MGSSIKRKNKFTISGLNANKKDMKLFDDKERNEVRPYNGLQNLYCFYDLNNQNKINDFRNLLNVWFESYPNKHKVSLKHKFKNDFKSAYYELYIYILFTKLGFSLTPDPILPDTNLTPDFLAKKKNIEFYIEAITTDGKSEIEKKRDKFKGSVENNLNKIESPNFWLYLKELKLKSHSQPRISTVKKILEEKISNYDADKYLTIYKATDINNIPYIYYEDENVRIVVGLIPKSKEARGLSDVRPIGITSGGTSFTTHKERAKIYSKALQLKAKKYKIIDKPLIVCINYLGSISDLEEDVDYTLLGDYIFNMPSEFMKIKGVYNRLPPLFTSVSAVLYDNEK